VSEIAMQGTSWNLWLRQVSAILSLELFKQFVGWRALRIYILAALPVLLMLTRLLVPMNPENVGNMANETLVFAGVYRAFILRFVVVFGCATVFTELFRGEVTDRSLHYYFMTPVRREVLAAGKYLSALVGTMAIFGGVTVASYLLMFLRHGLDRTAAHLLDGPGLSHMVSYTFATLLACVGYGALFLLIGLLLKNPILPVLAIFGWEWLYFLLPSLLKKISVVHYLQSIMPIAIDEGPFALLTEPTPAWISVPGFIVFSSVVLFLCGLRIRRMEIRYEAD
jgi:ABC-type transport system involved in multi-copper enzyme maturation permease subunit